MSENELREASRKALIEAADVRRGAGVRAQRDRRFHEDPGRFLGAGMIGIRCDEVAHAIIYLMHAGASYRVAMRAVPIRPFVAELIPTMLKQLEPLQ